jgi:hypothetical protein
MSGRSRAATCRAASLSATALPAMWPEDTNLSAARPDAFWQVEVPTLAALESQQAEKGSVWRDWPASQHPSCADRLGARRDQRSARGSGPVTYGRLVALVESSPGRELDRDLRFPLTFHGENGKVSNVSFVSLDAYLAPDTELRQGDSVSQLPGRPKRVAALVVAESSIIG